MSPDTAPLVRIVRTLCRLREAAKSRGEHDLTHERRCARLVLQGVLTAQEAEDALILLLCGIYRQEKPTQYWVDHARWRLMVAAENEHLTRYRCAREIKAICDRDLPARVPSGQILDSARSLNVSHGRPFVWPELRELVASEIRWFLKKAPRHG